MQRILVVEDDFDIQELLQNFLQEAGYEVAVANDGVEALSLFAGQRYDLIVLDIMLPKIKGSLFAKVFILTVAVLLCVSFLVYGVLAWYMPQTLPIRHRRIFTENRAGSVFDHIDYHRRRWSTRKQWK